MLKFIILSFLLGIDVENIYLQCGNPVKKPIFFRTFIFPS